ncbi:microcin-processing peptidase 1. Unknown type peptidase. MEROPS family U62 [Halopseudomonas xinjiangensis]|uniref:Microcin-processing peptidase 1 n=1 Tax=Halopseudomonas xinjiangensis TaxID=487184 RepID=A0A1H1VPI8_9GAMM|nr:metalloprotease PmbA [Halopseudomonas xinjiangensis]SDS86410.1 microcin-processing peptidase 1. Unknown type peptidase. MEROPS family U62 [Halopseudomonas xinjiangensis]
MTDTPNSPNDPQEMQRNLEQRVAFILDAASKQGASACEVVVSQNTGLSVGVRQGEVETVEFNRDQGFGITLYLGNRKGTVSTSDTSDAAITSSIEAALAIARHASEDPYAGLADAELMATSLPELDLYHPWNQSAEALIERALQSESAALDMDPRLTSDGANVSTQEGCRVYGNSHGFIGSSLGTRHSASAVMIVSSDQGMQRDYWYGVDRVAAQLQSPEALGRKAAERALARLGAGPIKTAKVPVLFAADQAAGLLGNLVGAIAGGAVYRKSTFLLDALGAPVFPDWVNVDERPHLPRALGSAAFDSDGLATRNQFFVQHGLLRSWVLSTYSGRKLGLPSTANAGGVNNLHISSNAGDLTALLAEMGTGLLVTEMMGQGVNGVTGDYSRGAGGFWVENGQIKHPVKEVTIAGNLRDMFRQLRCVGSDVERRGNYLTGSWLVDGMTVGGA